MSEDREFANTVSSQTSINEMLDTFEEVKNENKVHRSDCVGNISDPCMRRGLEGLYDVAEHTGQEYAIIGGIGTQLRGIADSGDFVRLMQHFGNRKTSDIDILIPDRNEALQNIREEDYADGERPDLDPIDETLIPYQDEIIEDAEYIDFSDIDDRFDFALYVPTDEDLVYTKVVNPNLENRRGTAYDLQKHIAEDGYLFDLDEVELQQKIDERSPDLQASYEMLENAGLDLTY